MLVSPDDKNLYFGDSTPVTLAVLEEESAPVSNFEMTDPQPRVDEGTDLWSAVLEHVKSRVNSQSYATWFEPTRLAVARDGELVVEGPNQFFVDWLAEHHIDT